MKYRVYTFHKNFADIVQWLQENVGPLLHSQPMIYWHGDGWHVRTYHVGGNQSTNRSQRRMGWCIEVEDPKKAVLCELRWA